MKKNQLKLAGLVLLLIGGLLVLKYTDVKTLTPDVLRQYILSFGIWAPILYVTLYTLRPLILFPAVILTLTGGLTFGPWYGTIYVLVGASLGAYLAFFIARLLGRETVAKFLKGKLHVKAEQHGYKTILFLRLVPLFPFDAISYGAGLSQIRFRDYALATPIGMLPGVFVYNVLGSSLRNVFSLQFVGAIGLVLLMMLFPVIYKKIAKKNDRLKLEMND